MPLTAEQAQECAALKRFFEEKSTLSQRAFTQQYGLGTGGNLNQYLNGRRPLNLRVAMIFASALKIQVKDFSPRLAREIAKIKEDRVEPVQGHVKRIPPIAFAQAGFPNDIGQTKSYQTYIDDGDYIYVDSEMPDGTYATVLIGRSMEPEFYEGDTIVVDPTLSPLPGDFVVAQRESQFTDGIESTFKKYRPRGVNENGQDVFELVPLNPDYQTYRSDREHLEIVGVMVEHRRAYRRRRIP